MLKPLIILRYRIRVWEIPQRQKNTLIKQTGYQEDNKDKIIQHKCPPPKNFVQDNSIAHSFDHRLIAPQKGRYHKTMKKISVLIPNCIHRLVVAPKKSQSQDDERNHFDLK
jgi:hypothetical protein